MDAVEPVLVSIIVAVYNVEKYLEKCFRSISSQTYRNIEIILVNDGSTDSSGTLCEIYAASDSRVKVVNKPNEGLYSARNMGVECSTGEYLLFVDGDDWLADDLIQHNIKLAVTFDADLVIFGHFKHLQMSRGAINTITTCPPEVRVAGKEEIRRKLIDLLSRGCGFSVWEQLIKRDLIIRENLVFPPMKRGTDMFFLFDLYPAASRIISNPRAYYYYNAFVSQSKYDDKMLSNHLALFGKVAAVLDVANSIQAKVYARQLFALWFGHVIPTNIVRNKKFSAKQKMALLADVLNNSQINSWLKSLRGISDNRIFTAFLLYIMNTRRAQNLYVVTSIKNFVKDNIRVNYKKLY